MAKNKRYQSDIRSFFSENKNEMASLHVLFERSMPLQQLHLNSRVSTSSPKNMTNPPLFGFSDQMTDIGRLENIFLRIGICAVHLRRHIIKSWQRLIKRINERVEIWTAIYSFSYFLGFNLIYYIVISTCRKLNYILYLLYDLLGDQTCDIYFGFMIKWQSFDHKWFLILEELVVHAQIKAMNWVIQWYLRQINYNYILQSIIPPDVWSHETARWSILFIALRDLLKFMTVVAYAVF